MDTTPNYDIPYPECDPPRVLDAADVGQIAALAYAADAALDAVYAQAGEDVFTPDTVRVQSPSVTITGQDYTPLFTAAAPIDIGGMADLTNGVVRILEPGRYWIGTYSSAIASSLIQLRTRILINGSPATNFQTPGYVTGSGGSGVSAAAATAVLTFQEPATVSVSLRHSASASLSWTTESGIWATQLERF